MASVALRLAVLATRTHAALYRTLKGRFVGRMGGAQICLLTTTGRVTGRQRTTPLMVFTHGDELAVVASNGGLDRHPAWYLNLLAQPSVTVQVADDVRRMTARTATPEERAEIWPRIVAQAKNFAGYEAKTSRLIPVVLLTGR